MKKVDNQPIDFYSISSIIWKSTVIFIVSQQKETHMGLEQHEGE